MSDGTVVTDYKILNLKRI